MTVDQQIRLATVIVPVAAALIAAGVALWQVHLNKKRELEVLRLNKDKELEIMQRNTEKEIQFRIHEQRKQHYEAVIKWLVTLVGRSPELDAAFKAGKSDAEALQDIGLTPQDISAGYVAVVVYGSAECVEKYKEFERKTWELTKVPKADEERRKRVVRERNRALGEFFLEIRRDAGLSDTDLTPRDMLIPVFSDILDAKNDGYYD